MQKGAYQRIPVSSVKSSCHPFVVTVLSEIVKLLHFAFVHRLLIINEGGKEYAAKNLSIIQSG